MQDCSSGMLRYEMVMSEDNFQPLVCNENDVISIANQVYKYGDFLKNIERSFVGNISRVLSYRSDNKHDKRSAREQLQYFGVTGLGSGQSSIKIQWKSPSEGIECEILKLGSQAWKKGKIRATMEIDFLPGDNAQSNTYHTNLKIEFCPDQPEISEPESPLDDIRRQMNQSKP